MKKINIAQNLITWLQTLVLASLVYRVFYFTRASIIDWGFLNIRGEGATLFFRTLEDTTYRYTYTLPLCILTWICNLLPGLLFLLFLFVCFPKKKYHPLLPASYGLSVFMLLGQMCTWKAGFVYILNTVYFSKLFSVVALVLAGINVAFMIFCIKGFKFARVAQVLVCIQGVLSLLFNVRTVFFVFEDPGNW